MAKTTRRGRRTKKRTATVKIGKRTRPAITCKKRKRIAPHLKSARTHSSLKWNDAMFLNRQQRDRLPLVKILYLQGDRVRLSVFPCTKKLHAFGDRRLNCVEIRRLRDQKQPRAKAALSVMFGMWCALMTRSRLIRKGFKSEDDCFYRATYSKKTLNIHVTNSLRGNRVVVITKLKNADTPIDSKSQHRGRMLILREEEWNDLVKKSKQIRKFLQ